MSSSGNSLTNLLQYGIDPKDRQMVSVEACRRDLATFKFVSCLAFAMLFIDFLGSFFLDAIGGNTPVYLAFTILFALEAIAAFRFRAEDVVKVGRLFCLVSLGSLLAVGIFLGVYSDASSLAVTFIAILLMAPSLYTLPLNFTFMICLVGTIVFDVTCYLLKPPDVCYIDIVNSTSFFFLGMVLGYFYVRTRLTGLINAKKLSFMSVTDALTGLSNRSAFEAAVDEEDQKGADNQSLCMVSVDVNGLKAVNDTLMHVAGDELLCGAADCMREAFDHAEVFRLGGDEFAIIAHESDAELAEHIDKLKKLAAAWHGEKVPNLSLAIGAATHVEMPEAGAEELYKEADRRMYEDKAAYYQQAGKNRRRR